MFNRSIQLVGMPFLFFLLLALLLPASVLADTCAVTSTADSGVGSLRAAITYANANPGTTVTFSIPTSDSGYSAQTGVFTIQPLSPLPTLAQNGSVINPSTQTALTGVTNPSGPEVVVNTDQPVNLCNVAWAGVCRQLSDQASVALTGEIVTAVFSDRVYIQEPNRSAGICLVTSTPLAVGDEVAVSGVMTTIGGERGVSADTCVILAYNQSATPMAMSHSSVGSPTVGGAGPDNGGLLVKVWGTPTYCDPSGNFFYMDDGSGLIDGNTWGPGGASVKGIEVLNPAQVTLNPPYYYVTVIGISACDSVAGSAVRAVRLRSASDFTAITPGRTVSTAPPTTPVVVDDGVYTFSVTQLHATWSSTCAGGIAEYQYAIGTTSGGTDVVNWTSAGTATQVTQTSLSLVNGGTYYFAVKAMNWARAWSAIGVSSAITVQVFPPTAPVIVNSRIYLSGSYSLFAAWTPSTSSSGIAGYQYAIGTTAGGTDVVNWTSAGTATQITQANLAVFDGATYYVAVEAQNSVGQWSSAGVSAGMTVAGPSFKPLKIGVIQSPDLGVGGTLDLEVVAQMKMLGIAYTDAHCDAAGTIQPGLLSAGLTDPTFEGTLDGAIVLNYAMGDDHPTQTALNKTHAFKMLCISDSNPAKAYACNTGMSSGVSLGSGVPLQAYTQIGGSEAESIAGYFGNWSTWDGVTPITKLLYLKFAGTQYHVAWEVNATGNMFSGLKTTGTGSYDLINTVIGLYINRLGKASRTNAIPMYINMDDENLATSSQCINNTAAALRACGGSLVGGWGSDQLIAGGSDATTPPASSPFEVNPNDPDTLAAWAGVTDVIPQLLHDHETLPGLTDSPILAQTWPPDTIATDLSARITEAEGWSGFPWVLNYGGFAFVAWNKVSTNGLIVLARGGLQTIRTVTSETLAVLPPWITLNDSEYGVNYYVRNAADCTTGNGDWRELWGGKMMTGIRYCGFVITDQTEGLPFYFHGVQMATNNAGGIRRHASTPMAAGDQIIVNGTTYAWVGYGATGNQLNVSGNLNTDMANLASILSPALAGIAAVDLTNDTLPYAIVNNDYNVDIVPTDPTATITVDCNQSAAQKVGPITCTPRDIALEMIKSNYINLSTLAPMYRVANGTDWQAL